jgi:hypothetical protein
MNALAPSVDDLLLHTLERFTRRVPDAPFEERWRTEVVLLEEDLATGPRAEPAADPIDTSDMRARLDAVTHRWRSLLREARDEHGLDHGHAGLLCAIDNWLTSWETT